MAGAAFQLPESRLKTFKRCKSIGCTGLFVNLSANGWYQTCGAQAGAARSVSPDHNTDPFSQPQVGARTIHEHLKKLGPGSMADFEDITGWREELAAFERTEEGHTFFNKYSSWDPKNRAPKLPYETAIHLAELYFKHPEIHEALKNRLPGPCIWMLTRTLAGTTKVSTSFVPGKTTEPFMILHAGTR
ncbi:hypothetical protein ACFQEX_18345 [Roseibium salinum]|uniref:hypothetical protein n=1 Tax=Roseibium salinum TaxID=1604349 RepID=UPI00361ED1FA